jgi:tRNA G18 (ribose-2'-O)-methylase SpoU
VDDLPGLFAEAQRREYQVVAVQQSPGSTGYDAAPYPPRPLFLMGAEDRGIPSWACAAADLVIEIPLSGAVDSLNVACAATVVMVEWVRFRGEQGEDQCPKRTCAKSS